MRESDVKTLVCVFLMALSAVDVRAQISADAPPATTVRSDSVRFRSGDVELHGMVRRPNAPGPHPAVLLLPGGGNRFLTDEPDYFAERLSEAGFVTLVYHKRATGNSTGDWGQATFDDFVDDAVEAMGTLSSRDDVDGRVGIMGFSQGGRLAPVVAARVGAAAVVSISGTQLPVDEVRLYSTEGSLRRAGLDEATIRECLELWREHLRRLRAGESLEPLDDRIRDAASRFPAGAVPPPSSAFRPTPLFNSLDFSGERAIRDLEAPFLAVFGERDVVVPTAPSVRWLHGVFAETGYADFSLLVIPDAGHALNDATGERHPLYRTFPIEWLRAHLLADRPSTG